MSHFIHARVFDIDVTFLWEVVINNKRLSLFTSSTLQTSSVKIWAKSIIWFTSYSIWNQPTSELFAKIEKSEFRVLIKHYFLRGKTLSETKAKLDKYFISKRAEKVALHACA